MGLRCVNSVWLNTELGDPAEVPYLLVTPASSIFFAQPLFCPQPSLPSIPADASALVSTSPVTLSFLFSFPPSTLSLSSPSLLPLFRSQLCNSANDAEKACCQHILQAAGARLHKLVNRAGPLLCQPLIITGREKKMREEERGRRRKGRGEGQK